MWMDHSPLVLWAIPHPAVPPWERPGGRHGLSGKHMPGGVMSDAVASTEAQRLGSVPRR